MSKKVAKFGGTSLADAAAFKRVAAIIAADPARRYIVASAPGKRFDGDEKVTDLLYRCHDLAAQGQDPAPVFAQISHRYEEIAAGLGIAFPLAGDLQIILQNTKAAPQRDYLASRGEYLNSKLLAAYLGFAFLDPAEGIFFDKTGNLDEAKTYAALPTLLGDGPVVVAGFYGCGADGQICTFSRGGSDVTGAIVARAVQADLYENWTDVSGMLMADPRCVKDPETIGIISYTELRELTYMGATVLHDEAVFPVRTAGIPINIRNTGRPADAGTLIVAQVPEDCPPYIITGVAGRKGFASITVEKDRMNAELGFGRKVLAVLEERGISFEHLPTGIDTLSVLLAQKDIDDKKDELVSSLMQAVNPDSVSIESGIALVAVVGRGMVREIGVAGRMLTAVAAAGVNLKMIDQGSSELNIIIGVAEQDYEKAINAIYHEFVKQ